MNGNALGLCGAIHLHIRLGSVTYTSRFYIAPTLACDVLVGTTFLFRFVKAIRCIDGTVELTRGTIPILGHNKFSTTDEPSADDDMIPECEPLPPTRTRIRIFKPLTIPPMSQAYVRVITGVDGTIHIEPKNSLFPRTGLRVANGTHEVRRGVPFKILITNFTHAPRPISKHMIVAYAVRHPTLLVALEGRGADEIAAALALPNTREEPHARHGPTPIDPAFPVATTKGPVVVPTITPTVAPLEPDSSWRDTVDLEHVDDPALRDRILGMLEKHQTMWNGRLGAIKATVHRIALKPNTRPIHQQPYRAGPKSRAILEEHIQSQLEAGVIEPAQSEWSSPIVLAPKHDGTLRFCVDYRRLNNATIPDTYPLPLMDDCIDSLGEAAVLLHWTPIVSIGNCPSPRRTSTRPRLPPIVAHFVIRACPSAFATHPLLSSGRWTLS